MNQSTNIQQHTKGYQELYDQSIADRAGFWKAQAEKIHWFKEPVEILSQDDRGLYRWFEGGELNSCYLALDYHVENGRGDQFAFIYDSPVTNTSKKYTYRQFRDLVSRFAGGLRSLGVAKGDTVVIYMPMIPEAAIAMLACARIGAVHSVVFGGFAPHELAIRIDDAKPKVIISASCGVEVQRIIPYKPMLDEAISQATHKPEKAIIFQRDVQFAELNHERDVDFSSLLNTSQPVGCVPVQATDPLYILYTSGTTGKPKGIVRDNGGHAVALNYSMEYVYGAKAGEVYWAASDIGWVVGHSYIIYGPLIYGCTSVLFEGKPIKTPDAGTFWRVIEDHKVSTLFTAPTAIRAIKKEDPGAKYLAEYDISSLRYLFLAGERCDPATLHWSEAHLEVPVIDHWWQTETGWPMVANPMGIEVFPVKPGSASKPVPGYEVCILSEEGEPLIANQEGFIAVKLPLPPGCLPTLWQDEARFRTAYLDTFAGYYLTGDGGYMDDEGYVYIMGRIDDVINVSGHRLSTGEMEELVAGHSAVAECAVVGIADGLRGQVPVGFVVLKDGFEVEEEVLEKELVQLIRNQIGAVAVFKKALLVQRLPKTRSGKILRNVMRKIADGVHYKVPSTIDDPAILKEIHDSLEIRKVGQAFHPTAPSTDENLTTKQKV